MVSTTRNRALPLVIRSQNGCEKASASQLGSTLLNSVCSSTPFSDAERHNRRLALLAGYEASGVLPPRAEDVVDSGR